MIPHLKHIAQRQTHTHTKTSSSDFLLTLYFFFGCGDDSLNAFVIKVEIVVFGDLLPFKLHFKLLHSLNKSNIILIEIKFLVAMLSLIHKELT